MTKDGWIDFLSEHILGKYSQQFPFGSKNLSRLSKKRGSKLNSYGGKEWEI